MKKIFLSLIFLALMSSCYTPDPMLGSVDYPFIVCKIEKSRDGMSAYYGSFRATTDYDDLFSKKPCIVLPSRMFNIGDTIKPSIFKH